jgi:ComEC/Rec2-related protein
MTDLQVVALAGLVWMGCLITAPLPMIVGVSLATVGFAVRSPRLVLAAGLALGLGAGAAADSAYRPIPHDRFDGVVQAVSLPRIDTFSEQIDVRLPAGDRVRMDVSPAAGSVRGIHPGMHLAVTGTVRPIEDSNWNRSRHVVGRLTARSVRKVGTEAPHWSAAAWLQRTVNSATRSMDPSSAALYQGLVTGDDRAQGAAQKAIFRRTGLSHILVVSGQNVAFVLVLLHLAIGSLPGYLRPPIVVAVLGLFALTTQLEPSVLRATFTAAIGYWAVVTGRRASGVRLLAVAVSALLLIDPFLAISIGFQLSVLASGGILVLGPAIASRVRGPAVVSVPVAVTLAAQTAVSPLLLMTFGSVSLVSLPANVLTGWAAGIVMMWGMSIGLVAGSFGGSFALTLQSPVKLLLWWIDGVAGFFADVPLQPLTTTLAMVSCGILLASAPLPGRGRLAVATALLVGLVATSGNSSTTHELDGGGFYISNGPAQPSVLVLAANADDRVVEGIVNLDPDVIDIVIIRGGHRGMSEVVREIERVSDLGIILAPPHHSVVGGTRVLTPVVIESRVGLITVAPASSKKLEVVLPERCCSST